VAFSGILLLLIHQRIDASVLNWGGGGKFNYLEKEISHSTILKIINQQEAYLSNIALGGCTTSSLHLLLSAEVWPLSWPSCQESVHPRGQDFQSHI
jgi:hypothetical protein